MSSLATLGNPLPSSLWTAGALAGFHGLRPRRRVRVGGGERSLAKLFSRPGI